MKNKTLITIVTILSFLIFIAFFTSLSKMIYFAISDKKFYWKDFLDFIIQTFLLLLFIYLINKLKKIKVRIIKETETDFKKCSKMNLEQKILFLLHLRTYGLENTICIDQNKESDLKIDKNKLNWLNTISFTLFIFSISFICYTDFYASMILSESKSLSIHFLMIIFLIMWSILSIILILLLNNIFKSNIYKILSIKVKTCSYMTQKELKSFSILQIFSNQHFGGCFLENKSNTKRKEFTNQKITTKNIDENLFKGLE
ncbi:hypothetical protein [Mycoplasma leonicaptivi]|uniref:hypothetical protein n=1 Tax=Mycoplasma leonicaptivi TaxID=36742 RepID=UPI0004812E6C|nr:hypothetical protein [Mycoplasma leonicaptivi]